MRWLHRCTALSLCIFGCLTGLHASLDEWAQGFDRAQALYQNEKFEKSLKYVQNLYVWAQKEFAANDDVMFKGAYLLALNLHRQNRLSEAQLLYQDVLNRSLKRWGAAHKQTQRIFGQLASVYYYQGLLGQVIDASKDYIEFLKKELGSGHRDLLPYFNGLAEAYRKEKLFDKAVPIFEHAYMVAEKNFPPGHEQMRSARFNLALIHLDMGNVEKAEEEFYLLLQEADDPRTKLGIFNNLGHAFMERGDFEEALSYYREALKLIVDVPYIEMSEEAVIFYNNLAELEFLREDYVAAERYYEVSLRVGAKVFGAQSVNEIYVTQQLGLIFEKQDQTDKAEVYLLRALNKARKIIDDTNPTFQDLQQALRDFYLRTGQVKKLESLT